MSAAAGASGRANARHNGLLQDPVLSQLCFEIVTHVAAKIEGVEGARFFVKGGAAYILERKRNPLLIENDIDCEIIIDPRLSPEVFNAKRATSADHCIEEILRVLRSIPRDKMEHIYALFRHHGLAVSERVPRISMGAAAENGMPLIPLFTGALGSGSHTTPFHIELRPSQLYRGVSQQIAVIRLRTRTEPSRDLIDIAIPAPTYKHLEEDWGGFKAHPVAVYGKNVPILNVASQIINQERALIELTNAKKRGNREARVANLRRAQSFNTSAAPATKKGNTHRNARNGNTTRKKTSSNSATSARVLPYSLIPYRKNTFRNMRAGKVVPFLHPLTGRPVYFKTSDLPSGASTIAYRNERSGLAQVVYMGSDGYLHRVGHMIAIHYVTGELGVMGDNGRHYVFE